MVSEAHLESVASGLAPVTPGWFVVNTADAAWMNNDRTGGVCIFESDDYVLRALRAGAGGFLLKDTPPADIVRAVRAVAAGEPMLSPAITRRLISHVADSESDDRWANACHFDCSVWSCRRPNGVRR